MAKETSIKQRFYPLKPTTAEGFKKAVAWLGGRELVASLKGVFIYAIYGENMDPRSWMKPNIYPDVEEKIKLEMRREARREVVSELKGDDRNYEKNYDVIETLVTQKVNDSTKFQSVSLETVNREWANKIYSYWEWKSRHFRFWENYLAKQPFWEKLNEPKKEIDEFWFDYIADSGDGQMGVYGVGCMCLSDLWVKTEELVSENDKKEKKGGDKKAGKAEKKEPDVEILPPKLDEADRYTLLPRGAFLFVGGDTAYHSANYATLFERFQTPFRWAFMSVRKLASARENYVLKRTPGVEKKFRLGEDWTEVFEKDSTEPVGNWDGTIGDTIDGKDYWDTEPLRPIFGVPANHDYYDSIDGFNKQFRRAPFEEIEENMVYDDDKGRMLLQIPSFSREQEASYTAIRLPFGWWMLGIDSENEKLDYRQEIFFKQIMKRKPKKLILTTPEPTTVFGKKSSEKEKTTTYLKTITRALGLDQPFLRNGKFVKLKGKELAALKDEEAGESQYRLEASHAPGAAEDEKDAKYCRLDLSGDVHHYARYWGANTREFRTEKFSSPNYASLVAGGGGAFFDPTETLIGEARDGDGNRVKGEIPPQKTFPDEEKSLYRTSERLFDLWNIKKGGYVQTAGAAFAVIIYYLLTRFSNVSHAFQPIDRRIREGGLGGLLQMPALADSSNMLTAFTGGVVLLLTAVLLGGSAYVFNKLIESLKARMFEDNRREISLGKLWQALFLLAAAVALYLIFLKYSPVNVSLFTNSYYLLAHFIICGLLIWLSLDYSNLLPVAFKINRDLKEKTIIQKVEDPNEKSSNIFQKIIGQLSREYSWRYIPAHLLVAASIFVLLNGLRLYGDEDLSLIFADLLLMIIILGGFALISYVLAVGTGAAYYKGETWYETRYKWYFFFIGAFHAVLQLLTPFIIYYYTNIYVVLAGAVLVLLVNGLPVKPERLNIIFPQLVAENRKNSRLRKISDFSLASVIMNFGSRTLLTISWVVYGLIFLIVPFLFLRRYPQDYVFSRLVQLKTEEFLQWLNYPDYAGIVYLCFSILIVGYLGYYLSRVWFSWYLAVSLAFNGHNNEAGGAARIEGFKHMLRIRVRPEELTVFVIGFEEAQTDISQLKLKLVDEFTLACQPLETD